MNRIFPMYMEQDNGNGGGGGDRDFVAEATAMGWVPEDKWTGAKDKWTDAQTFVERGEKVLPIVLKENRELKARTSTLEAQMEQMRKDSAVFQDMLKKTAEREKKELTAQYEAALEARADAVANGDKQAFKEADEDARRLEREAAAAEARAKQPTEADEHPDFKTWVVKNPWYTQDVDLKDEADEVANRINRKRHREGQPLLKGNPLFEQVMGEMAKRHPDKFGADERGSTVEGESEPSRETRETSKGRGKAKTYENLPADAKQACDRFIKQGLIPGKTDAEKRAAYCANYDWS